MAADRKPDPQPVTDAPDRKDTVVLATRDHITRFILGNVVFDESGARVPAADADHIYDTARSYGVELIDITAVVNGLEDLRRKALAELPTPEKD